MPPNASSWRLVLPTIRAPPARAAATHAASMGAGAAVRATLGAAAPFDILPAVWLTSIASVGMGILAAKLLRRLGERHA